MLKNKIISVVITIILGVFIIPLFIDYPYNIAYGIYGSAFTVPSMLLAGVISILIEKYSENKNIVFLYIKHLFFTLLYALLFSLVYNFNPEIFVDTIYLTSSIGSIYITVFFICDYLLRYLIKSNQQQQLQN